jgi:hypothetical protein
MKFEMLYLYYDQDSHYSIFMIVIDRTATQLKIKAKLNFEFDYLIRLFLYEKIYSPIIGWQIAHNTNTREMRYTRYSPCIRGGMIQFVIYSMR